MSDASVKKEALKTIRGLVQKGDIEQAINIAKLFKVDKEHSTVEDLSFYGKLLIEIGRENDASEYLEAAIKAAHPEGYTKALESLFWQHQTPAEFRNIRSGAALFRTLRLPNVGTVLDVGSGGGEHALHFAEAAKEVHCVDFGVSTYVQNSKVIQEADAHPNIRRTACDFMTFTSAQTYDLVWCSHVLEHQPNPKLFLEKCISHLNPSGWLAITVPPLKHQIVGGHVTLWNAGLLLYQLVHAGLDCSGAVVMNYDYNISIIVQKNVITLPDLDWDAGDIDRLAQFFPAGCREGFDGRMFGHAIRMRNDASSSQKTSKTALVR
jgi:SAM-dependent methyltransferase